MSAEGKAKANPMVAVQELREGTRPALRTLFLMLVMEFAAFAMLIPIFPFFLIHEIGLGPERVGTLLACFSMAQLVGGWGCGRVSDATGRRPVIIGVFAWAAVGFAATSGVYTFWEILVVRAAQGISGGTASLCDAYLLDSVESSARASYMGLSGAFKGLSFVIGPGVGALLIFVGFSRREVFIVSGCFAGIAALIGLARLEESLDKSKRRPLCSGEADEKEGAGAADSEGINRELVAVWFIRFSSALGLGFMYATYAFLIKDNFGWSDVQFGMVLFCSGLCGSICQLLGFPYLEAAVGAKICLSLGCGLGAVGFSLLVKDSIPIHIFALTLFCLSNAVIEPSLPVLVGEFAGERHLGFATGIVTSCRAAATVLSPLLAGSLYKTSPTLCYNTAASCFAVACVVASLLSCFARPRPQEGEASKLADR